MPGVMLFASYFLFLLIFINWKNLWLFMVGKKLYKFIKKDRSNSVCDFGLIEFDSILKSKLFVSFNLVYPAYINVSFLYKPNMYSAEFFEPYTYITKGVWIFSDIHLVDFIEKSYLMLNEQYIDILLYNIRLYHSFNKKY